MRTASKHLLKSLRIVTKHSENILYYFAEGDRYQAGYLYATNSGDRIEIDDFKVYKDSFIPYPIGHSFLMFLGIPCRKVNFRGQGIGGMLMQQFLTEARKLGIREIYGSVTQGDATSTSYLLDFYRKYGFCISAPDADCRNHADMKVSLRFADMDSNQVFTESNL